MNLLQKFEQKQIDKLLHNRPIVSFKAGDTIKVHVKIIEGTNARTQIFEGLCIARKNRGLGSTFTVKKISNGEGVERVFLLYSTTISAIEVVKVGKVRRAKLYYMRKLSGKAARIKELNTYNNSKNS